MPNASILNYLPNDVLANGAILKVSQTVSGGDWNLYSVAATHFAADVTGYYSKPMATALECVNAFDTVATVVPVGSFVNVADGAITACPATYTGMNYIWNYTSGTGGISVWNNVYGSTIGLSHAPYTTTGNTNMNLLMGRRCCRIPGR